MTASATRRRSYTSPGRRANAERTRTALVSAAQRSFSERGWDGTSMRDLAREAGVSVETIYASVGNKVQLLRLAIDVAVVGDLQAVDLAGREAFQALGRGPRKARLRAAARMMNDINQRVGGLQRALEQAALTEPQLADELAALRLRQVESARAALRLIVGQEPSDALCRGVLAIAHAPVRHLFVDEFGETTEGYEQFLTRHFAAEIQAHQRREAMS